MSERNASCSYQFTVQILFVEMLVYLNSLSCNVNKIVTWDVLMTGLLSQNNFIGPSDMGRRVWWYGHRCEKCSIQWSSTRNSNGYSVYDNELWIWTRWFQRQSKLLGPFFLNSPSTLLLAATICVLLLHVTKFG